MSKEEAKAHTISRPIIYGSVSQCTGKAPGAQNRDRFLYNWMVYVRGPNNEDLSSFIDRVVFILHDSFDNNVRTVTSHPYIVEESGWGQFEIVIRIHFKGEFSENHVQFAHMLKVETSPDHQFHQSQQNKKLFLSEYYDELIFVNPSPEFETLVQNTLDSEKPAMGAEESMSPSAMNMEGGQPDAGYPANSEGNPGDREVRLQSAVSNNQMNVGSQGGLLGNAGMALRDNTEWTCKLSASSS